MPSIYYSHNVDNYAHIIDATKSCTQNAFNRFKQDIKNGQHPIFDTLTDQKTFNEIDTYVQNFDKNIKTLIILGTGGSSLGARAIASWIGFHPNPLINKLDINFFAADNLDDLTFTNLVSNIDFETTHFLIISKSGNTLETTVQMRTLFDSLKQQNKEHLISTNFTVITELKADKNNLHHIADTYKIPTFSHSLTIGGRYSVLTMTGLMPAAMMGIDYRRILAGAQSVVDELLNADEFTLSKPCHGAAALIGSEQQLNMLTHIYACYGDRFYEFATWIRQLWAESLGKDSKGGLFVPSLNPLDQHSQLQMYYSGINNKTYSFIECKLNNTPQTKLSMPSDSPFSYLNDKTIHDTVHASYMGTIESLRSRERLVRTFTIDDFSLESLGALMMHHIIETVFSSYLLDVNPYDQPAVEDYKKRTKKILQTI